MIQVVIRALDILEFVSEHGNEPVQLIKIAEHLGLSQSTTANIVKTLLQKFYLEQVSRKDGYRLGIAAYWLTGNKDYDQALLSAAKEPMEELSLKLKETTLLALIRNNKRLILHLIESNQPLQVKTPLIADIYNTSTGRLLMAYLNPQELQMLIKSIGLPAKSIWPKAETLAGLEKALATIRKEEFVQISSIHHTIGFAVPIIKANKVIAGLSVFVPKSRYTELHKEKIFKQIRRTANLINERLLTL